MPDFTVWSLTGARSSVSSAERKYFYPAELILRLVKINVYTYIHVIYIHICVCICICVYTYTCKPCKQRWAKQALSPPSPPQPMRCGQPKHSVHGITTQALLRFFISFSAQLAFYIDKGFVLFYMSPQSLMTSATGIHKIRLFTLYREENNKGH